MFIKNFSSVNKDKVVLVDEITKNYLQALDYIPLSYKNGKWAFVKTDDLLNTLKLWEGGNDG